jgi:serine phosphatase RsbU (regulator of sigma subunit)/Tfp pilus assembly protein PilF
LKYIIYILLFLLPLVGFSQNFADKEYYLVDSLVLEEFSEKEIAIIDSCLNLFHSSNIDTIKVNAISFMVESSSNFNLWPKYNRWLYQYVDSLLNKELSKKTQIKLLNIKAGTINNIGFVYGEQGDVEKQLFYYKKAMSIFKENNDLKGVAGALNNIGYVIEHQGKSEEGLKYYFESLKIEKALNNKAEVAKRLNNIAAVYQNQGILEKALEYYYKSIKIKEELADTDGLGYSYNNLGYIYLDQKDSAQAFISLIKGLKNFKASSSTFGIAMAYNSIGYAYDKFKNYSKAHLYYQKSLKIYEELNNKLGYAIAYNNIGGLYKKESNYDLALKNYLIALELLEEVGNKKYLSKALHSIGELYFLKGDFKKATDYGEKNRKLAEEIGFPSNIKDASILLSKLYEKQGDGMKALAYYKKYSLMKDSLYNDETQKVTIQQQSKFEYQKKKELDDANNEKRIAVEKEKQKRQYIVLIIIIVASSLVFILMLIIYRRLRITKKQKIIIEEQRDIVEEAHKEIRDSINYAERIQRSFLATEELLNKNLVDYFVFFKPKDVVSGDFYWAGLLANNQFAIVNADSTGHGVPGAIMSILNISSVEKAVEKGITNPAEIFNDTRKTIIERLKKDGSAEGGKDGMDASIISFDFDNNKFNYTAAQNPIWIVRNGELLEIKPEKMPIGKHDNDTAPFVGGEFETQKGDVIYTLTDGFQDQFGGEKGKKFKVKPFKNLLISIAYLPMHEQKEILNNKFAAWKGKEEQVDDVCVIGVKIN